MDKNILVALAHGTEEMEAVTIIDLLRRAGLNVKVAGENEIITCSRGVKILPDIQIEDIPEDKFFDIIIIPGGINGTKNLTENQHLEKIIKKARVRGTILAAICAAPTLLSAHGILKPETKVTSHPSVKSQLLHYDYVNDNVVESDGIVTSRGAGTAIEFSLKLIELLVGKETAMRIANDIVY